MTRPLLEHSLGSPRPHRVRDSGRRMGRAHRHVFPVPSSTRHLPHLKIHMGLQKKRPPMLRLCAAAAVLQCCHALRYQPSVPHPRRWARVSDVAAVAPAVTLAPPPLEVGEQAAALVPRAAMMRPVTGSLDSTPRFIWTYWDKGEAGLPEFLRICLESWRHNCPDWQVVVLGPSNVLEFLELGVDLPSTFFEIDRPSLQSDVARLAVLARYGGIYTDISTLAMSNVAEQVRKVLDDGASVYSYHNFAWLHDFVAAWFMACKPNEEVMIEWSRALNHILEGRTNDHDIHLHPYLHGVELSDYHGPRPVGPNHPSKCWADYLIVNVALRALLVRNPRLAERFWRTACLIDHGHANCLSPTRMFDHAAEVGINVDRKLLGNLHWPDGPLYVSSQLLRAQDASIMRNVATAPFVKFFQAGKVCSALQERGLNGLERASGIEQLIKHAFNATPGSLVSSSTEVRLFQRSGRRRTAGRVLRSLLPIRIRPKPGTLLAAPFAIRHRPAMRLRLWAVAVATMANAACKADSGKGGIVEQ